MEDESVVGKKRNTFGGDGGDFKKSTVRGEVDTENDHSRVT